MAINNNYMDQEGKLSADQFFTQVLEAKKLQDGSDQSITEFEDGKVVEAQNESVPAVEIPKIQPTEPTENIPEEVSQTDQKLAEVVEEEIQSEGGDVQEIEAEVGVKTEIPPSTSLVDKHQKFIKSAGDAGASEAEDMEKIWDPLGEEQAA